MPIALKLFFFWTFFLLENTFSFSEAVLILGHLGTIIYWTTYCCRNLY